MRFKIVCILLALLALCAEPRAATMCRGIGSNADITFQKTAAWKIAALPEAMPTVRITPGYGAVAWWHVSDGFEYTTHFVFGTWSVYTDPALWVKLGNAAIAPDRLDAARQVFASYPQLAVDSGPGLLTWCPHWDEMQRSRPANPAYIVAKNGISATRPAYAYTPATVSAPAVRASKSTARATVTATCDCKVRMLEGSTLYCATNVERTVVAVCVKA